MSEEHQTPATAADDDMGAKIEKWFTNSFSGSILARDTEVWNFARSKLPDLVEMLKSRG